MEKVHELLGYHNIKIIQHDDMFSFSGDSMLLAHFVNVTNKTKRIIDLGCGNAPIPLYLTLKTKAKIIGVDIQSEICDMARRSVSLNNLDDQIEIINSDIKDIYKTVGTNCFDIVTSNPPYFKYKKSSNVNKNDYLTIARHEVKIDLDGIVHEAKKLLNEGGCLYMVHRAERFSEIVKCLDKYHFAIKRLKFMYPKKNSSEALLVIFEAKNNAKEGMKVLPPIFMYNEDGTYTDEALEVFNFKKQNL